MSPEAQNIAIAELVGFDLWAIVKCGAYYRENAGGYTNSLAEAWKLPLAEAKKYEMYADRDDIPGCEKVLLERAPIPNYAGDLNAMHAAEQWAIEDGMDADQWDQYGKNLESIHPTAVVRSGEDVDYFDLALVAHCTAAQRAEAFLRTLGRWTEESK